MVVPGSQFLGKALHLISQSLLIPVIAGLLLFMVFAILELGSLISEYSQRTKINGIKLAEIIKKMHSTNNLEEVIANSELPESQKIILESVIANSYLSSNSLKAFGRKLIEEEEVKAAKSLEKTDIIGRLGPALGLMGTLIPLGPGLASLGKGDVESLASAVIIAFDTTVVGLAAGGIGYAISKIRRRWYEDHISTLETLIDVIIGIIGENTILSSLEEECASPDLFTSGLGG